MKVQTVSADTGLSISEADTAIKNGEIAFDSETNKYYVVLVY